MAQSRGLARCLLLLSVLSLLLSPPADALTLCGVQSDLVPSDVVPTNVGVIVAPTEPVPGGELVFENAAGEMRVADDWQMDHASILHVSLSEPLEPDAEYTVGWMVDGIQYVVAEVQTGDGALTEPPPAVAWQAIEGTRGRGGSANEPWSNLELFMDMDAPDGGYLEVQASEDGSFSDAHVLVTGDGYMVFGNCGTDLESGTSYTFRVRAVNAAGLASPWSEPERARFPRQGTCQLVAHPVSYAWVLPLVMMGFGRRRQPVR